MLLQKKVLIFIFISVISISIKAEELNSKIGFSIGTGSISSNSPNQTVISFSSYFDFYPNIWDNIDFRISALYAKKYDYFLPSNGDGKFYSYLLSFGLSAVTYQKAGDNLWLEESIGGIFVYDKIFRFQTNRSFGFNIGLAANIKLKKESPKSSSIGIGLNYGLTFNNYNTNYFLYSIQYKVPL